MARDPVSRRRFVALAGLALSTASLAGCAENGGDGGDEPGAGGTPTPGGTPAPGETPTPTPDGGGAVDPSEWEGIEEIYLDAYTEGWEGVAPEMINGETNPTLVLFEGNEYTLTWENRDGAPHDFTIWTGSQEVLESTEQMDQEGETLALTFTASQEMAQYVCTVHPTTMIGDLQVESG